MITVALTVTLAVVSHAQPIYDYRRDAAGVFHYRVFRVRTPAWDREVPIPAAPRIVRRILRCRELVVDQERDELRFSTDEDMSSDMSQRIDLVALGTGLVPYFEELARRAQERSFGVEQPSSDEAPFVATIAGKRPVLLKWRSVDGGRALRLTFHVAVEPLFPGGAPTKPSGEIREYALTRDGDQLQFKEISRRDFDPAKPPPRHEAPTVGAEIAPLPGSGAVHHARLDRLSHHCLANDRYAVRWLRDGRVARVDFGSLYGSVRFFPATLDARPLWIGTREDRDEGAIVVWPVN